MTGSSHCTQVRFARRSGVISAPKTSSAANFVNSETRSPNDSKFSAATWSSVASVEPAAKAAR